MVMTQMMTMDWSLFYLLDWLLLQLDCMVTSIVINVFFVVQRKQSRCVVTIIAMYFNSYS